LFLHSSIVQEKWKGLKGLKSARWDSAIAIGLGGLVSIAVVVAASRLPKQELLSILDMAETLEPLYGIYAKYLLGFGMFAAGITSTLTAALAAAYVLRGCLGWKVGTSHPKFKWTWRGILFLGVFFSSLGNQSNSTHPNRPSEQCDFTALYRRFTFGDSLQPKGNGRT